MSDARGEVGKPLLVSLAVVWAFGAVAFLAVDWLLDSYIATNGVGPIGLPITMMQPGFVVIYAVVLSLLLPLHWWFSGLFGEPGIASRPIANLMLVAAGLCVLQIIFEGTTRDYFDFSVLCRQGEPSVTILVDEFYICERSMVVTRAAGWLFFALPILAIPVRIIESRIGMKRR